MMQSCYPQPEKKCPFRELDGQRYTGSNLYYFRHHYLTHLSSNLYKLSHLCKSINLILMPYQKNHTAYYTQSVCVGGGVGRWRIGSKMQTWVWIFSTHLKKKKARRLKVHVTPALKRHRWIPGAPWSASLVSRILGLQVQCKILSQ